MQKSRVGARARERESDYTLAWLLYGFLRAIQRADNAGEKYLLTARAAENAALSLYIYIDSTRAVRTVRARALNQSDYARVHAGREKTWGLPYM